MGVGLNSVWGKQILDCSEVELAIYSNQTCKRLSAFLFTGGEGRGGGSVAYVTLLSVSIREIEHRVYGKRQTEEVTT